MTTTIFRKSSSQAYEKSDSIRYKMLCYNKCEVISEKLRRMPVRHTWRANLPELNCGVCFSACAVGQCGIGEKS